MSTVSPSAPISIHHGSDHRGIKSRNRASTLGNPGSFYDGTDLPPKPLIGSMPTPSFLNADMPPLELPPSSWEKPSILACNEDIDDSYDASVFMGAASVPRDHRFAQKEHSMRHPLKVSSSSTKQPFPPSGAGPLDTVPFPGVGQFDKMDPPVVVKARSRTRSSGLETTLERVLSSSLLGYNESDPLSPSNSKKASQKQTFEFPNVGNSTGSSSQPPSKLSELMEGSGSKLADIQDQGEESSPSIQSPIKDMKQGNTSSHEATLENDFDNFIDADEEDGTDEQGEVQPFPATKFGSGDFGMFVEEGANRSLPQIPIPTTSARTSFGSFGRARSSSSPLSDSGSHGSMTALSMLSGSRNGSMRESEILRSGSMEMEAVVSPSPVPFPEALRKLSKEVETRAEAARSFDLQANEKGADLDLLSDLPPPPNPNTANSPSGLGSRNAHLHRGLSDSAEWEAVRQAPMQEPFDMEV